MSRVIPISSVLAVALLALYLAFMVNVVDQVTRQTARATTVQTVSPARPVEKPARQSAATVEEEPETQPAAAVQESAPAQQQPATDPEPSSSTWTDAMNSAGIAPADQPIALELLFTDTPWNVYHCACARQVLNIISPEGRFYFLNGYVIRNYGSWAGAKAQAATGAW